MHNESHQAKFYCYLSAEESALIITALLVASAFYLEHALTALSSDELRDCANYVVASNEMNALVERFQAAAAVNREHR